MTITTPEYELLYFPLRGRGEQIRLLFACAQIPFKNTPIADWPSVKASMPLGQLPVLRERVGERETLIPQTGAILRHLARAFDLYGSDEQQRTQCDILIETFVDWRAAFAPVDLAAMFGTAPEAIARYWSNLPSTLALVERFLTQSAAPEAGWFVGPQPTVVDVIAFDFLERHVQLRDDALAGSPSLKAFVERFRALPGVAAYLKQNR
ncbi:glutathione S-transferase family protein [Chondromyces crocatus]|uniref:glutathione transferase n=1 Tax=Chondromyces crocatus TaxID=52 RepID=A0A0K1EEE8_CHOCO|nr:glutathione S-transferase family protein [Chondromyces crocatus]AKT38958.1 uncharacterized protein CMC5_031050 [Chondromyces crocatus]